MVEGGACETMPARVLSSRQVEGSNGVEVDESKERISEVVGAGGAAELISNDPQFVALGRKAQHRRDEVVAVGGEEPRRAQDEMIGVGGCCLFALPFALCVDPEWGDWVGFGVPAGVGAVEDIVSREVDQPPSGVAGEVGDAITVGEHGGGCVFFCCVDCGVCGRVDDDVWVESFDRLLHGLRDRDVAFRPGGDGDVEMGVPLVVDECSDRSPDLAGAAGDEHAGHERPSRPAVEVPLSMGPHHDSLARYQSTVRARPSSKVTVGAHPSSVCSRDESMA